MGLRRAVVAEVAGSRTATSCNGLADEVETNSRCLLDSLERAQHLLENGTFNNSEPGPYRIFAVYSVAGWSRASAALRMP